MTMMIGADKGAPAWLGRETMSISNLTEYEAFSVEYIELNDN
jgi:hypothetical protein